jgi:hypothetical protein
VSDIEEDLRRTEGRDGLEKRYLFIGRGMEWNHGMGIDDGLQLTSSSDSDSLL